MSKFYNTCIIDMIYLGADHRGYKLKEHIKVLLGSSPHRVIDCGAKKYTAGDDYVDYAKKAALAVRKKPGSFGILMCGSGGGMVITANKFAGIRAVQAWNAEIAGKMRKDGNANVLVLAADFVKVIEAKKIVKMFLETKFSNEKRHVKRLRKIEVIEKKALSFKS